jgi:hypothetical protein
MSMLRVVRVLLAVSTASGTALAQTPGTTPPAYTAQPPAYTAQPPGYAPPPPLPHPAHQRKLGNAHADRVIVTPTAYTHPAGTFYATSYDIALLQIGYALNDSTQISVTGTPPVEGVLPLDLSLKTRVLDERRVRIALIASATGIVGLNQGDFFLGRGGGVVQLCFDDACKGSFSIGSTLLLAGPASLMASGAGAIVPVAHWLHLLFEADTLLPIGREAGPYNGATLGAGARFPFRSWAIDIGAVRALGTTSSSATIPLLAITYRHVP